MKRGWPLEDMTTTQERQIRWLRIAQRSLYGVALVGLIAVLLVQTYRIVRLYLDEPTYFSTSIAKQRDAPGFPAFTVCGDGGRGYKEDVFKVNGIPSEDDYYDNKAFPLRWVGNDSDVSPEELFTAATFEFHELVSYFFVRFFKADEADGKQSFKLNVKDPMAASEVRALLHRFSRLENATTRRLLHEDSFPRSRQTLFSLPRTISRSLWTDGTQDLSWPNNSGKLNM